MPRPHILLFLIAGFILLFSIACSSGDEPADTDGDTESPATDGDLPQTDGDLAQTDGDEEPDPPDGDVEQSDGDTDGKGETDRDSDLEAEVELEPLPACEGEVTLRDLPLDEDTTFDLGPYLMNARPNEIVIMWRTLEAENGTVFYGTGEEPDLQASHEGDLTIHEIELTGLEPDTRYSYKVQSGERSSRVHHFHTAVSPNQSFRFALWGDNQSGWEVFTEEVDVIAPFKPHILLGVGDHVNNGRNAEDWKNQLFGPARKLFHELPFFPSIGNHEGNGDDLYALYSLPHPEDDPQHESYYSFTYGNAFFMIIDTNKTWFPIGDIYPDHANWIREQVASPEAKAATWRFALNHEPGYSEGWGNGSCTYDGNAAVRNWLYPLLAENGFHAHFSGHMHGYERGMNEDGLVHIISGGGGGHLDAWCLDWPNTTVAHYVHHFLVVDVGCDQLRIGGIDLDGTEFDWVVLNADQYGQYADQGPMENLPPPTINTDSPSYVDGDVD